jgi:hypothetical protein
MEKERPVAFISYSWDSKEHQDWVLKLADSLMEEYGVEVILDQNELQAGKDLMYFMESSMERASKVLLILTPNYKLKAEGRAGGAGFEYSMISQGLFEVQSNNNKFIPVLRSGSLSSSSPNYVKSKIYHDMKNDNEYEISLYKLAQIIYDEPPRVKPKLGPIPDFKNTELDPHIKVINELIAKEKVNNEINSIIDSNEGLDLVAKEIRVLFNTVIEKAKLYSDKTDFIFSTEENDSKTLVLNCQSYSVVFSWSQVYSNTLHNSSLSVTQWAGRVFLNRYSHFYFPGEEPKSIKQENWIFDLSIDKKPIWIKNKNETAISSEIANSAFSYIIERIKIDKSNNLRV